jgi:hypothetical protein
MMTIMMKELMKGHDMVQRNTVRPQRLVWMVLALFVSSVPVGAELNSTGPHVYPAQVPYEKPVQPEYTPGEKATPAPEILTPQDKARLESLIPLLEGRQEYWAIGEFVHYGKHSVPYLVKALKMPGSRVRFNAVETLSMIKDPSGIPGLLEVAMNVNEESRIRSHALRVATRLDPNQVIPALKVMAKDDNSTIRNAAVFESRNVQRKEILPIIISAIADPEQYVSITARDSFWILTRFSGPIHDWEISTPEDRKEWVKEWWAWWEEHKDQLWENSAPKDPPSPPENLNVS